MAEKTTVLITGATGNIGTKLRRHLAAQGRYDLRLLDLRAGDDPAVVAADLSVWDDAWAAEFRGVDTVLHVAADPSPVASWARIQQLNLDLFFNVMAAAQQNGVRRVVFASSNYVVAGYRFRSEPLTTDLEPLPGYAYGMSKLVGERLGKMFAERYGLSFIAFRIGVNQRRHENRFGPWIPFGGWGQEMWCSDRDLCGAFQAAIDDRKVTFGVYNLVSNNPGMRWDIAPLRRDLGFVPQDGEPVRRTPGHRLRAGLGWLRLEGIPALARRVAKRNW